MMMMQTSVAKNQEKMWFKNRKLRGGEKSKRVIGKNTFLCQEKIGLFENFNGNLYFFWKGQLPHSVLKYIYSTLSWTLEVLLSKLPTGFVFLARAQPALKMFLASKVVRTDPEIIILLRLPILREFLVQFCSLFTGFSSLWPGKDTL